MPLRHHLLPLQDYCKAKRLAWDPEEVELGQDRLDWRALDAREQDVVQNLLSLFVAGEEGVASTLAPLLWALGKQGGLREEEMFLTSQILDESRHVEFFHRYFEKVVSEPVEFSRYWGSSYRALFFDELPAAMDALLTDRSPQALLRALLVYHFTVEGMLAETGYHAIFLACERHAVLPGLAQGITLIKRDESRHIAYGIYALQRLLRADASLWSYLNEKTNELLATAIGVIPEALAPYGDDIPFGIRLDEMTNYAIDQFNKRFGALERVIA